MTEGGYDQSYNGNTQLEGTQVQLAELIWAQPSNEGDKPDKQYYH